MKVLLKKHKSNGHIEIAPVYFSSLIKTVINLEYDLDKSFQEVLYRIDDCINEGSGWVIEWINGEYEIYIFLVHYQEVHILKTQWKVWLIWK